MESINWIIIFSIYIFLPLTIVVNGDIVDNINNQTIFQNYTKYFQFQDVNSTITPPLEILSNKAEESNVSYIYPKKVNKTEELIIGRTEKKLYTKDEYGNDILLIFSSPLEIVNNPLIQSIQDTEIKTDYNQTQSNLSNVTLSREYVKDKYNATYNKHLKTSEKTLIKGSIDNDKENATSDSTTDILEDTNKNLLKRLTNFSKLRYKKRNQTRSNPVKRIRISNHAFDKINATHKANTTITKLEKVKSSLHFKNDLLHKSFPNNNTENIPKMQIKIEIENSSTSKDNISSKEIDKSYSVPKVHSNKLNKLKIVREENDETSANSNGVESKLKKIDNFHVDMIPFTLEDAMVAELRNYWTKPDTKSNNNIENLQDMIRDTVMNVHKNLKQKQLMKNKKVTFTNNGGKKYINYGPEDPKQLSSFKHIQDPGTRYNEQGNFNIHLSKSMNKRSGERISLSELTSPLTESELLQSVMGPWDHIQEMRNKEFMHSLIPIPETVAPTANNGLLIVGPLPKSLPQHFKSEPFKDQLQLPGF